jgi:hypothetical protein
LRPMRSTLSGNRRRFFFSAVEPSQNAVFTPRT